MPIALDETLDHVMRRRQVGYWYKGVDSHVFCPAAACMLKSWVLAYQSTWRISEAACMRLQDVLARCEGERWRGCCHHDGCVCLACDWAWHILQAACMRVQDLRSAMPDVRAKDGVAAVVVKPGAVGGFELAWSTASWARSRGLQVGWSCLILQSRHCHAYRPQALLKCSLPSLLGIACQACCTAAQVPSSLKKKT